MSYVTVKGGSAAIRAAHRLVRKRMRGDPDAPEIAPRQIREQMHLGVDRVMAEASLYDENLAARAMLQAQGDMVEAIFLLRAYRATLTRFLDSTPLAINTMRVQRRISAAFKDLPGGQQLGETYDYSHRLFGYFDRLETASEVESGKAEVPPKLMTSVMDLLEKEGLMEPAAACEPSAENTQQDITQHPLLFPTRRAQRLQSLARSDEGFLLSMAYSTQRGYGQNHPFIAELRMGEVTVEITPPELGFSIGIGTITVTECQMINQFRAKNPENAAFTRGYGLVFGHSERKAIAMALVDRALRAGELGEKTLSPAQDEQFVLSHCDNVEATGFVEHLKLPHYVDFQSEIQTLRHLRKTAAKDGGDGV